MNETTTAQELKQIGIELLRLVWVLGSGLVRFAALTAATTTLLWYAWATLAANTTGVNLSFPQVLGLQLMWQIMFLKTPREGELPRVKGKALWLHRFFYYVVVPGLIYLTGLAMRSLG